MVDSFNKVAYQLKTGNRQAGELIFGNYSKPIYRFFLVKTFSRETAEDLMQDVFVKVIDKIGTFDENLGSFSGWLWQIAKNTIKDYYRKKKAIPLSDAAILDKERKEFLEGKNDLVNGYDVDEISEALKNFTEEEQEVFSLHYLSDLPYRTISKALGKSESSLRVAVYRINKKLKKTIKNE